MDKISVKKDGAIVEYDVLFTLDDEKKNIKYIAYTDNTKDENDNTIIYLGRYSDKEVMPVSNEEKEMLEKVVSLFKERCE